MDSRRAPAYIRIIHLRCIGMLFDAPSTWRLSVYVDDIKVAGKERILKRMWERLMKQCDLKKPSQFLDQVVFLKTLHTS